MGLQVVTAELCTGGCASVGVLGACGCVSSLSQGYDSLLCSCIYKGTDLLAYIMDEHYWGWLKRHARGFAKEGAAE